MGEAEIIVGCPHRLRQPIGPSTKHPCAACAVLGVPPRWAIANTVSRPRLTDAVTAAARAVPMPTEPIPAEITALGRAINTAARQIAERTDEAFRPLMNAIGSIEMGPISLRTEDDDRRDAVRVIAEQTVKVRYRA